MKFVIHFKPNTLRDYGVRLVVNHSFLRSRSKSVAVRVTYSDDGKNDVMVELFVPNSLISEVPEFFVGELMMLSPQIVSVQRA